MKQCGFIQLPLLTWGAIAAGAVIVALGVALKIQSIRLESCQTKFEAFRIQTKAIGDAQIAETARREAADRKLKEKVDADHKATIARLQRDVKRLRDDNARRSAVPDAPAGSSRPDLACFDRTELDRAVSGFIGEVTELVAEGTAATVDLEAARAWARSLP